MLQLNNTTATLVRERGNGQIAGETIVRTSNNVLPNSNTISDVNDSSSMSNTSSRLQRRRNASSLNDSFPRNMRPRRMNLHGGISPGGILPPSTSQDSAVNVNDLFSQYNSIASSMVGLSREHRLKTILAHARFRPTNVIDDEILKYEKEKFDLECAGKQCTSFYSCIVTNLKSLNKEKVGAESIDRMYLRIVDNENNTNDSFADDDLNEADPNPPNSLPDLSRLCRTVVLF